MTVAITFDMTEVSDAFADLVLALAAQDEATAADLAARQAATAAEEALYAAQDRAREAKKRLIELTKQADVWPCTTTSAEGRVLVPRASRISLRELHAWDTLDIARRGRVRRVC